MAVLKRCCSSSSTGIASLIVALQKSVFFYLIASLAAIRSTNTKAFIPPSFHSFASRSGRARTTKPHIMSQSAEAGAIMNPLETMGLPHPLILGSGSFTRKLILREMGISFQLLVRPIDEQGIGDREKDDPQNLVTTLAKAKSDHLVSQILDGKTELDPTTSRIVLTADQVVTHDGKILEKPLDIEEAKSFVSRYGSIPPRTVGACVLTHTPSGIQVCGVDCATIVFRPSLADIDQNGKDLVDRLMDDGAPVLECAGGLMVEHDLVKEHIERIDGTEDSVMGLSKDLVLRLLEELRDNLEREGVVL